MKGTFKGFDTTLNGVIIFTFFIMIPLISAFCGSAFCCGAACLIGSTVGTVLGSILLYKASNLICRWSADDKDFTITILGFDHSYRYSEITDIKCEYINAQNGGAAVKLTVSNRWGDECYVENCNIPMTELLNDPDGSKKPQLMILCDYVKQLKGAAV
ncbi:MAG: hypothetical protein K6B74_10350 [Ruminococcus sp.]|nr:hypothetical protein [Ruminococcus sp.]